MQGVINYMEIWVEEQMGRLLNKSEGCTCDKCKRDIFALALNNLQPCYVVTPLGRVMVKLQSTYQQFDTDIIVAVTKAIKQVQKNPNHDKGEL